MWGHLSRWGMASGVRLVSATLLAAYLIFLVAVLTEYNPTVATDVVSRAELWLTGHGAPAMVTGPGRVEFMLNTAMFAPVAFLAALTFPRHPWANWVVYALVASGGVELLQGLYLPPRSAQFEDVVANTSGALLGALPAAVFTRLLGWTAKRSDTDHPAA